MKQVLVIALLMFPIVALGANKGVRPYRGPAHVLEIPNPVVVNDTISIRLKVEVRECVDEIEIRYYDWQGSLVISRQQTREMDTATFHMRVRVPTSRRADFKAYVIERALEGETPCARENTVTETDGSVTVRLEDIKPGDQSFKFPVPLKRAGDSVRLIELIPVYDNTGKTKPDSSTPPRPMEIQYDRIAPQIIEDSGGSSSIDSQQVAPKDTARKP
ncbi:MAG: hypothetical protein GY867_06585, partial [bacterium]|nr:hypothetical protein [bacterium]